MTESSKSAASHLPKSVELSPDEIQFREREPLVQLLRLALGHAQGAAPGSLAVAEVGIYRGRSFALTATELARAKSDALLVGFDSFCGLPPFSEDDAALATQLLQQRRGLLYSDTSRVEVEAYLRPFIVGRKIEIHEGMFADTFSKTPERRYIFVNISCKLHSSTKLALEYFYPRLAVGGVLMLDDYLDKTHHPARVAADEFMVGRREALYQIHCGDGMSTFRRAFIVKQG